MASNARKKSRLLPACKNCRCQRYKPCRCDGSEKHQQAAKPEPATVTP